jgi:hypothetical protein
MGIKNVVHNGKVVIVTDFRGLKESEQIRALEQLTQIMQKSSTSIPFLNNFEGANLGSEFVNRVQALSRECQPKINRQALFGITGLKNILLKAYIAFSGSKEIKAFDNETEAMDWLVS